MAAGFSVDASVRIEGVDRAGIERLVRYCARPPFAPARGPPQSDLLTGLLDQTPAFDRGPRATHVAWGEGPAEPDPVPDFDFDQPDDFDLSVS